MKSIKAGLKFTAFGLWTLLCALPQMLLLCFTRGPSAYYIPWIWENGARMIFGIRYEIIGTPVTDRQTFYACNHLSYLDIPVLGSVLRASFLAKSEVADWPVFGFLSKLQQTEFIDRRRTAISRETDSLASKITAGRSLIIFPEGTSTDGQSVLPFKSSLFSLVLDNAARDTLTVQPMTIQLLEADGRLPSTQEVRDIYAWHREMTTELPAHLWRFAQSRGARVRLTFHAPLQASAYDDRKVLAKDCHENVSKGLSPLSPAIAA